ncbi:MAG: dihydroorotate dehydrogenase electron transfer subunit [Planctomycetota bacterium]|nr:MAG: dihydroorotate dehydrogenase electron transfer subunit [Planctomycetota bacterium]
MESIAAHAGVNCGPLAAAHYADRAVHVRAEVVENVPLAQATYRLRLRGPEISRRSVPGQFFMLRLADGNDPLLGRPLALYDTWCDAGGRPLGIDVVYLAVGRMTRRLAAVRAGDELEVWGPLGNGFSTEPVEHLVMVAGGIGQTPFLALGREALGGRRYGDPPRPSPAVKKATLCYGVRSAHLLAGVPDFEQADVEVRVSSDDGTIGRHGLVTDLLSDVLADGNPAQMRIACCGPEKMMEAVAHLAAERGVACEVSLETPMACGIGICFSCVVKVRQPDGGWDYKRTCVEGPIFTAEKIVW